MPVGSCTRSTFTGFVQETPASSEYDVVVAPPVTRLPSWIGSPTSYARPASSGPPSHVSGCTASADVQTPSAGGTTRTNYTGESRACDARERVTIIRVMRFRADRPLGVAPATINDYRELARRRLPRQLFDYIDGGAYEEATLRANVGDLESVLLRQVVMRDVSVREKSVEVLGQRLAMPVVLAPVGLGGMFAPRAEVQAARAAEKAGIPFIESTVSIAPIEEVAKA